MRKLIVPLVAFAAVALVACRPVVTPPANPTISVVLNVYLHPVENVDVTVTGLFPRNIDPSRKTTDPYPPGIYQYAMTPDGSALDRPVDGPANGVPFDQWDVAAGNAQGRFTVRQVVTIAGTSYECEVDFPCAVAVIQPGNQDYTYRQWVRLDFDD